MYILIAADGGLSLQDSDNMRAFSIREEEAYGYSDMTNKRVKAHVDQN